jgi:hypothetical protein
MSADDPVVDALLSMDAGARPDPEPAFLAIAAYADRVVAETDGTWPPFVRASQCREALRHIARECRRECTPPISSQETR